MHRSPNDPELERLTLELRTQLETWDHFTGGKVRFAPEPTTEKPKRPPESAPGPARPNEALQKLSQEALQCQKCPILVENRTQVVFGTGDPHAQLVFVGEAPGFEEDRQGEPFVGKAGELLTKMIQAMGYKREEVYICNVLKCRPPENRNPLPDEVTNCWPFLDKQLSCLRPKVLVALGKFAAQTLLRTERPISALRGKWHDYDGIPLMPTFHPAYLLRNPEDKRLVWADLKLVMARLGAS